VSDLPPDGSAEAPLLPSTTTPSDDVAAAALVRVRDVTSELVRLVRAAASQAVDGWSLLSVVRPLVPELERVLEERETLDREVQLLRTDVADADERVRELESQLGAREAGWNAERAMLETEVGRERDQVQVLTEELERRRAEGELLATRERRVREQMEAVAARAHADREETLRLARDMVQSAEDARLAVVDEMDSLRAALADEQASLLEVQHERALVSQDAAQREAELGRARQMIEQLEASRLNANGELARARAKLVETESELLAAQHEYQLAQVQIDKLCSAHDDLVEDRAQLVARLHEAKEREARLRLRITGLEQRIQAVHEGTAAPSPDAIAESALDATASGLALELSRSEERARVLEGELVKAKAAASAAALRVDALQEQARTADQARLAAETALRTTRVATDDRRRPSDSGGPTTDATPIAAPEPIAVVERPAASASPAEDDEYLFAAAAPVENDLLPDLDTADDVEQPLAAEEPVAVADEAGTCTPVELEPIDRLEETLEPTPLEAVEPPASEDAIEPSAAVASATVVIDGSGPWPGDDAVTAHVLVPADATGDRLRELDPSCCLVNLGAAGGIEAAAALRAADVGTPFFACVADDTHVIALGRLDVLTRPVDPERVRTRLEALAAHGANVIMVGSESGLLIPLRQGVLQAGMSVRTAWNRTQAVQLADTVHPDVVIVDVASETTEIAALLCDLARRANAPRLVVVVGTPAQQEELRAALISRARDAEAGDRTALLHAAVAATRR
jgi:DNA-binding response OmpR family regulator